MNKFNEEDLLNYLKDLKLIDIINLFSNANNKQNEVNIDTFYTTKDLIKLYPNIFSKYKINKYIKEENLPFIQYGKERLFLKSNIDDWLNNIIRIKNDNKK